MKLTCADPACERAPMRERDGRRWCMYHPDQPAPDIDLVSGKLRGPDGKPKPGSIALEPTRPRRRQAPRPTKPPAPRRRPVQPSAAAAPSRPTPADVADAYDAAADRVLQAELDQLEATDPAVAAAAASYDRAVDSLRARPTPAGRPGRQPTPIDEADAALRYQAGEGLGALAADLHIGVVRLRQILAAHDVPVRSRGDVLGQRGRPPRPIDEDECERLYREGLNSHEVARRLGVKQRRVTAVLRGRGALRAQPGSHRPFDVDEARRMYASGLPVGDVARMLGVRTSRVADVLREFGELRPKGRRRGEVA